MRFFGRCSGGEVVDGIPVIFADLSDFHAVNSLYQRLNGEAGGQSTKLTRREAELIRTIRVTGLSEITVTQMQRKMTWSNSSIYKLLHRYMSRGVTYSGLLKKCPAISFTDRTVVCDAEGATTHRRTRAYTWDESLYTSRGGTGMDQASRMMRDPHLLIFLLLRIMEVLPLVHVRIKDFKSLDGFGKRSPCDVCNGRYVHYIERLTKERERTKRSAFRMCRSCYARAQQREAARCIALPGTDCGRDASVVGATWEVPYL